MKTRTKKAPIHCAVLGLGRIGWGRHIGDHIGPNKHFELAAVCDIDEKRLAEAGEKYGCALYTRYADMLAHPGIDLVVVAALTRDHARHTRAALETGHHVLSEKPLARSPKTVEALMRLARRKRRLFTVHHNHRLMEHFLLMREVVESGVLGRIFRVQRNHVEFRRRDDWQVLKKYGGGLTGNWGVHLVDQCLQIMPGRVTKVWSSINHVWNPGDAEDDLRIFFENDRGMLAEVEVTYACAAPKPEWIVYGDRGTLWVDQEQAHLRYFDPKKLSRWRPHDMTQAPGRVFGRPDHIPWREKDMPVKPKRKYPDFYENLYAALSRGEPLMVTPESALRTYDVLARARRGTGF